MKLDALSNQIYIVALNEAKMRFHEFITPEHLLYASLFFDRPKNVLERSGGQIESIKTDLQMFFNEHLEETPDLIPSDSVMLRQVFEQADVSCVNSNRAEIGIGDIYNIILGLNDSYATYIMKKNGVERLSLLKSISSDKRERAARNAADTAVRAADTHPSDVRADVRAFAQNIRAMADGGELAPFIGREDVMRRTMQVLSRSTKNNPLHVGEPGVGKTALVAGLAQLISSGKAPQRFRGSNIYRLDIGLIVAGTKYRGDFEERFLGVLDEIAKEENAIIHIDEMHNLSGTGSVSGGSLDAAALLRPYLERNAFRVIGSTGYEEYKKHFEGNPSLLRCFQKIDVDEVSADEAVSILRGIRPRLEAYHDLRYPDECLKAACELGVRYLSERKLPDKAIDILDETGARLRLSSGARKKIRVGLRDIETTVAMMAKVPENSIAEGENEKLARLGDKLKEQIFGQDEAIETVSSAVKASRLGLSDGAKPVASLLFVGPTGVGKTELAKQLALYLNMDFLRFDMSEYQEAHSVARLIGSPPGYVGYDEGGRLIHAVRKSPSCVLLLDEIEKAHQDIMNLLLQVMDYGSLTDGGGKKADLRNVILIMTSNAGAKELGRRLIGFDDEGRLGATAEREIEKAFSPEFRNRLDEIVLFNHIDEDMALLIARKALNQLAARLKARSRTLSADDEALRFIARKGLSRVYGAREIIRTVERDVKKQLVDRLLAETSSGGKEIKISVNGGELAVDVV